MNKIIRIRAFRIVLIAWLFGWFLKVRSFWVLFSQDGFQYQIGEHPQFPSIFVNPVVPLIAYFAPVCAVIAFRSSKRNTLTIVAVALAASSLAILLHVEAYNDATFVTSFWVALWMLWLAVNIDATHTIVDHGCLIAQGIFGFCFLGGAIGKWTAEYWSGDVFHYLYFQTKTIFFYNWMRESLTPETVRTIATAFSRIVIITETILGLSIFFPTRIVCVVGIVVLLGMGMISTMYLFSVLACLIGLLAACLYWHFATSKSQKTDLPQQSTSRSES